MAALSEGTLAALLRKAGFPEDKVPLMVNIAKRESGLRPDAHNPNAATGDNSYGLFQINMIGNLGPARLKEYADIGVTSYEDLKDPWKNVQAAKKVFDSQGLGAWTTYQAASKDPRPSLAGGDLSELMSATDPKAIAARGVDPLSAAFDSLFGAGTATQAAVAPVKDKAMGLDFVEQLREIDPGAAAQVAAVTALLPQRSAAAAEIASLAPAAAEASSSPAGGLKVIEYLTGDPGHSGYRDDHGGSNYHEHLAFETKAQRDAAMQKLKAAGIQIGSVNDGKHSPTSYHYQDLAFDIPAAQVPVGKERELSRRVRSILGIG